MPTICLIPGDGVGQEAIPAAARVLAAVAPDLTFVQAKAGWECFQRCGTALPDKTLAAVAAADATLFGATQSPSAVVAGYHSPILALRRNFNLYANLRPITTIAPRSPLPALRTPLPKSTCSSCARTPRASTPVASAWKATPPSPSASSPAAPASASPASPSSRRGCARQVAGGRWQVARLRLSPLITQSLRDGSQSPNLPISQSTALPLTLVHKANVLKLSDGLFRESCLEVAQDYPDIAVNELLVDAAAMWLVKDPTRFDVLVTTNLFGDILSDLAAGLVGGLGVAPSANVGAGRVAIFEPVHGSAPDIAGRGVANPVGAILSAALLLEHIGRPEAAARVCRAVTKTLTGGTMTADLGGAATTDEVTDAIIARTDGPVQPKDRRRYDQDRQSCAQGER